MFFYVAGYLMNGWLLIARLSQWPKTMLFQAYLYYHTCLCTPFSKTNAGDTVWRSR